VHEWSTTCLGFDWIKFRNAPPEAFDNPIFKDFLFFYGKLIYFLLEK
jgi:hypothetical protein